MSSLPADQFARLVSLCTHIRPEELILDKDICYIGRLAGVCDIVATERTVSRIHAKIRRSGFQYELYDLSPNGTFVNGRLIEGPTMLHDQDTIGLASQEPLLRFNERPD
jgi:pSer/pThr/pTyr-binding forkhead associated (FHA) protein